MDHREWKQRPKDPSLGSWLPRRVGQIGFGPTDEFPLPLTGVSHGCTRGPITIPQRARGAGTGPKCRKETSRNGMEESHPGSRVWEKRHGAFALAAPHREIAALVSSMLHLSGGDRLRAKIPRFLQSSGRKAKPQRASPRVPRRAKLRYLSSPILVNIDEGVSTPAVGWRWGWGLPGWGSTVSVPSAFGPDEVAWPNRERPRQTRLEMMGTLLCLTFSISTGQTLAARCRCLVHHKLQACSHAIVGTFPDPGE